MRHFVLLLLLALFVGSCDTTKPPVNPTTNYRLGLNLTPASIKSRLPVVFATSYSGTLPRSYYLTTPPVGDQGQQGSCVGWATAYTLRTYYKNVAFSDASGTPDYSQILSPSYLYNQIKISGCLEGSYFINTGSYIGALDLLKDKGVPTWNVMPYNSNDCNTLPTNAQHSAAASHKIASYERVANFNPSYVKGLLVTKQPILIGVQLDDGFVSLSGDNAIWRQANGQNRGGHAMVIVGYDDSKNAYRVQNQWGRNWGDDGFVWIDYSYFQTLMQAGEAYIIKPVDGSQPPTPVTNGTWAAYYGIIGTPRTDVNLASAISNGRGYMTPKPEYGNYYWSHLELNIPTNVNVNVDNLTVEMRIKNPSSEGGISAYDLGVHLDATLQNAGLSWMGDSWASSWANMRVGNTTLTGLSELASDFNNWVTIKIQFSNNQMIASYNGVEAKRLPYSDNIGSLTKFLINFKGSGSVDWVKFYQGANLKMEENFDLNGASNIKWF